MQTAAHHRRGCTMFRCVGPSIKRLARRVSLGLGATQHLATAPAKHLIAFSTAKTSGAPQPITFGDLKMLPNEFRIRASSMPATVQSHRRSRNQRHGRRRNPDGIENHRVIAPYHTTSPRRLRKHPLQ